MRLQWLPAGVVPKQIRAGAVQYPFTCPRTSVDDSYERKFIPINGSDGYSVGAG